MRLKNSYQSLPNDLFSYVSSQDLNNTTLIIVNTKLIDELHLADINKPNNQHQKEQQDFLPNLLQHRLLQNNQPIAQAYAGHQFGHLNILGDGRAVLLGEVLSKSGHLTDIQLKGSGRTPYSRGGDGKASLSSMLREYLISEAMHALNIPTTRSLAVVSTGEMIQRHKRENGAILVRTASSHIRVGTFVYAHMLSQEAGNNSVLISLLDYTVNRHYPQFSDLPTNQKAVALLDAVMDKQAELVANWQRVGFIHGVMNTDNVTLSGETIDYGPCAFMDGYDEQTVFSSIDRQGRYAFNNQMPIMWWNMARFAESLLLLIQPDLHNTTHFETDNNDKQEDAIKIVSEVIDTFGDKHHKHWSKILCGKIGLPVSENNFAFANKLLELMQNHTLDYTNTFVNITLLAMNTLSAHEISSYDTLSDWIEQWQQKLKTVDITQSIKLMQSYNPMIIPRNHLVETALSKVEFELGKETDYTEEHNMDNFNQLLTIIQQPYQWDIEYLTAIKKFQQPASDKWNEDYQTFCGT